MHDTTSGDLQNQKNLASSIPFFLKLALKKKLFNVQNTENCRKNSTLNSNSNVYRFPKKIMDNGDLYILLLKSQSHRFHSIFENNVFK